MRPFLARPRLAYPSSWAHGDKQGLGPARGVHPRAPRRAGHDAGGRAGGRGAVHGDHAPDRGRRSRGYQPATLRDLEKALRWQRGSVRQILAGGDPVPFPDEPVTGPLPAVALAPSPEPGYGRDDAGSVPSAVTRNVVLAAINPHERALWKEIHSYPEGIRADEIFSDPLEAALFAREYSRTGPGSRRSRRSGRSSL